MSCIKPHIINQPEYYCSNNLIPKPVHKVFKKKCKLMKQVRPVTSIDKYVAIRDKILELDIEIKNSYQESLCLKEQKMFEIVQENENMLYQ